MQPVDYPSNHIVSFADHLLDLAMFHTHLLDWGKQNKRNFPWRETHDPFAILIAEMMLRRTQAQQVSNVYASFMNRYPDAPCLAAAPAEEVEISLYSLGLAWRVPAFQQIAKTVVDQYGCVVPSRYDALIALPGVGDYVASAVCCFAFNQPVILSDTNTVRVVGRLFGVSTNSESRRRKSIREMLGALLDQANPRVYNYSLLDLAAMICVPVDPFCHNCPINPYCKTGQERMQCQNG